MLTPNSSLNISWCFIRYLPIKEQSGLFFFSSGNTFNKISLLFIVALKIFCSFLLKKEISTSSLLCKSKSGYLFVNLLTILRRISLHLFNIDVVSFETQESPKTKYPKLGLSLRMEIFGADSK